MADDQHQEGNIELGRQLERWSTRFLESGTPFEATAPEGVRILDSWTDGTFGAVLFWVDAALRLHGDAAPTLERVCLKTVGGEWALYSTGGTSADMLTGSRAAIAPLAVGGRDPLRVTVGVAAAGVAWLRLRAADQQSERPVGVHGFFIQGITQHDPVTRLYALDRAGRELPEPILL